MDALLIYNPVSGHHKIHRYLPYIKKTLENKFEKFLIVESTGCDFFIKTLEEACEKYDAVIVCGGDGTVNMAVNVLSRQEKKPILGIIPTGTINDAVRNLGLPSSIKKSVKTISQLDYQFFDVMKVNDRYASYVLACGAFSDIPYVTSNLGKRIFGRFAYYFRAIPRLFHKKRVYGKFILSDGTIHEFCTPFVMVLKGKRMGGFVLDRKNNVHSGTTKVYYAKPALFNSILKYFFRRSKIPVIVERSLVIDLNEEIVWDIDGEKMISKKAEIVVLPDHIRVFR